MVVPDDFKVSFLRKKIIKAFNESVCTLMHITYFPAELQKQGIIKEKEGSCKWTSLGVKDGRQ